MEDSGLEFLPDPNVSNFHDFKFRVFLEMLDDQLKYRKWMQE
jgi:hypothetical protein